MAAGKEAGPVELTPAELDAQRSEGIPGPDSNDELRVAAAKRGEAADRAAGADPAAEQPRAAEGAASRGQVDR